jgi:hypothetical protein
MKLPGLVLLFVFTLLVQAGASDERIGINEPGEELSKGPAKLTITESAGDLKRESGEGTETYDYGKVTQDFEAALKEYESAGKKTPAEAKREHIAGVLIGFILEVLITLFVLKIAFQVCGFPVFWHQIILLSLAIGLAGAMLEYVLHAGLLNPVRIGLSFILLLILIRQMTDVREWATAIKIALTARLISIVVLWLCLAGLMMLFGL